MQAIYLSLFLFLKYIIYADGQQKNHFFRDDYKYMEETKSFYKIHTMYRSWEKAKTKCSLEGAKLFYAEDENEVDMVLADLNNTHPIIGWVYVGISSHLAKGVFKTVDGVAVRAIYNVWGPGEPNDNNGEENCVVLRRDGTLNDEKCSNRYPFICKKTLQSLKWNEECNTPYLGMDKVQGSYLSGAVHLGFYYDQTQKSWRTFTGDTLEEAGYSSWAGNQPDGGENERCGSMFYEGSLNDIGCDTHRCFFVCEKENKTTSFVDDKINEV
ncbi:PREDICTED: uncharacterized protein LOC106109137 [Papilio polytes]|uniref:uncharacterized protein LOC106109137 n=1 Tax=Papilio polytes TaxID=76194 RepID=UPI00067620F0|nr:PREDICTED: uncharacterized protein LOC106109137 [Papilio polytes]